MPKGVVYDDEISAQEYADTVPGGRVESSPDGFIVEVDEVDELGYMGGGMVHEKRSPINYSKGGAVKGKSFSGCY
jgi:hypothetical protein